MIKKRSARSAAMGSALLSALAMVPQHGAAKEEDKNLEEVLVHGKQLNILGAKNSTATKMDVSIKDTGRSMAVLNEQQLDDLALENIRQAFDYVAGFRGNGPADRTYTARGVRTSIDNVMVDGLRSLQGGEAGTGSKLPTTFNAESTTFLRGPAGLLYGAGVGGGLVNITTKKPQAEAMTELSLRSRSYVTDDSSFDRNRFAFGLDSTGKLGTDKVLYRVIAQYTPDGDDFQEGRSLEETLLDLAFTFRLGDSTLITPRYELADRDRTGGSGYADGVFEENFFSGEVTNYGKPVNRSQYYGSPDDRGENSSESVSLRIDHEINSDWQLTFNARANETEQETLDLYISDSSGLGNEVGELMIDRKWVYASGEDEYTLFDLALEGKFTTGSIEHHVLLGANYRDMEVLFDRNFQSNDDALGRNTISVLNPSQQLIGPVPADLTVAEYSPREVEDTNFYLKDRVTIGAFTLVGGLARVEQETSQVRRGETYTGDFSDTIWDFGVIYALSENTNLFATYSRSFDPVNPRYIAQYGQGKNDYKPVEGNNYEIGIKGNWLNDRIASSITLFQLERENATKFERDADRNWVLLQLSGKSYESKGLEWDASYAVNDSWIASVSYAFTRAHDTVGDSKGIQANNTPKHSLALWNNVDLNAKWRAAFGLRYESERNDGDFVLEDYVEADAGVYYTEEKWNASLFVRNLFDKNRAEAGANWVTVQPNEPRSLSLSVNYQL